MKKDSIGIGLMGLGVVGGGVARVLSEKADVLAEQTGCPLVLRKVLVRSGNKARPLTKTIGDGMITTDEREFFATPDIDIFVELIGGETPALGYQKRALEQGKHVVTANKEVIAKHGAELLELARRCRAGIHFEASVGGGIPLIAPFQRDLIANRIESVHAIINGTTNYILTRMAHEGTDFAVALKQAQELGYAEADPTNDVEGIDATYKLAILASLGFRTSVKPEDIFHEGISKLSARDFRYAQELGFAIKLLAIGKQSEDSIEVRVHPAFIPKDAMLAKVDGVFNAVEVQGDLTGGVMFIGRGAGASATSSAVIADIVSAAHEVLTGVVSPAWKPAAAKRVKPMSDIQTRFYLRMNVSDSPGVLANIAQVLGDNKISISSVIQKETDNVAQTAEIVIMTHPAQEKALQKALKALDELYTVREISNFVRVEDWEEQK